jgi:hypothetical protein
MMIPMTPLWSTPVEIAMQGAVARICHKYHENIHSTSPYYYFGERNEEGSAMDRRSTKFYSIYWTYMTEREYIAVSERIVRAPRGGVNRCCSNFNSFSI